MRLILVSSAFSFIVCLLAPTIASSEEPELGFQLSVDQTVAPLEVFQDCPVCPEMIALPMGAFMMGAIEGESRNPLDLYDDTPTFRRRSPDEINIIPGEHPRHRVEIDTPFAMGRNEITHDEWMACVEAGGCTYVPEHRVQVGSNEFVELGPNHPVINVSFLDMKEYVAWLNSVIGADFYRLPTEAEWEYAARAGTSTRFAQGEDLTAAQANFSRNGTEELRGIAMPELTNRRVAVPVNELDAANSWGLRHMSGNVIEITMSCWTDEHLGLSSSSSYLIQSRMLDECRRVVKGGHYNAAMDFARPAGRGRTDETFRSKFLGFRVVREIGVPMGE